MLRARRVLRIAAPSCFVVRAIMSMQVKYAKAYKLSIYVIAHNLYYTQMRINQCNTSVRIGKVFKQKKQQQNMDLYFVARHTTHPHRPNRHASGWVQETYMAKPSASPIHPGAHIRTSVIPAGMSVKKAAELLRVGR